LTSQENIKEKMDGLEEHLRHAGIVRTFAERYLQQVRAFRAQVYLAFAPADARRILEALELMNTR
jgi:hypothetical protein